jgi:hypothetical protein
MPRMLDLFCGRWGWSRAFAARGWDCYGVDLVEHPANDGIYCPPAGCRFIRADVLDLMMDSTGLRWGKFGPGRLIEKPFDFICASSPCEQFSVHGFKCFYPNPAYPEFGIKLFNHTREICEASGVPYVMENVRPAQQFVGQAVNHCGPFYLWGNGVPPLMPQGIIKGKQNVMRAVPDHIFYKWKAELPPDEVKARRREYLAKLWPPGSRKGSASRAATIPPELSSCVADFAERLLEQRSLAK